MTATVALEQLSSSKPCLVGAAVGDEVLARIVLSPSGGGNADNYLFEVSSDGMMRCQFGVKAKGSDTRSKDYFQGVTAQLEVRLSSADLQAITSLLNELESGAKLPEAKPVLDSWSVALYYNGNTYTADYYDIPSEAYQKLADKLVNLSPITVDLHGWA